MICGTARRACLGAGCGLELGGPRMGTTPPPRLESRLHPASMRSPSPATRTLTRAPAFYDLSIAFERRVSRAAHPVLWTACLDDDREYAHEDGAYPGPSGSASSTAAAAYPRRVPRPTARRHIAPPRLTRSVP
ncbi:hypothetical protein B0H17DRAFT_1223091 [Mycena rosella]|uniref:Uncharacterized protein n=1 Tax=Mycena rosella TaxID=1033263 RepID=A0AAD7F833_MYCRO|nr:hypothetical protein B0H17DRAFT_1223091 [Mycena rosella]